MGDAFLTYLRENELSGWVILIIGGGTVVAALITAIQAVVVAAINAWSAKRIAVYNAHRERRAQLGQPAIERMRSWATLNVEIHRETRRLVEAFRDLPTRKGLNDLHDFYALWLTKLRRREDVLNDEPAILIPGQFRAEWLFLDELSHDTSRALLAAADDQGNIGEGWNRAERVAAFASLSLKAAAALEAAVEAYIFGLWAPRLRARWSLVKLRRQRSKLGSEARPPESPAA
jgi:hypothetical protein